MFLLLHSDDLVFRLGYTILICIAIVLLLSFSAARLAKPKKRKRGKRTWLPFKGELVMATWFWYAAG